MAANSAFNVPPVVVAAVAVAAAAFFFSEGPGHQEQCAWCPGLVDRVESAVGVPPSSCTPLWQRDFDNGTLLVSRPGCFVLREDVEFHPAPGLDFRAVREPYTGDPAFVLDFPAAILVRSAGVTIDLGGQSPENGQRQSREHYLKQRFFAAVELTTPFLANEGAADFIQGREPTPASTFVLRNGKIGLSSHHAIHGNDAFTVLIEDVICSDYEVGAVSLNGARDVVMRRVKGTGTLTNVPVLGTFSSARFILPFAAKALALAHDSADSSVRGAAARLAAHTSRLQELMDQATRDFLEKGAILAEHHEAHSLFANPSGLPDGAASYGFVVHARGHASNGFECDPGSPKQDHLRQILIDDCEVRATALRAVEVPVLQHARRAEVQQGPAGDVIRIADVVDDHGRYKGTALSDTKIALQELVRVLGPDTCSGTNFGYCSVDDAIVRWANGADDGALARLIESGDFRYVRGGDSMFHVNKGSFGIRLSGGRDIAVRQTRVTGVSNTGAGALSNSLPGEKGGDAYWTGSADGGHPMARPQQGYGGADAVGIAVEASAGVILEGVEISSVHARNGWAAGLRILNGASSTELHSVHISNVSAGTDAVQGPKQPRAIGLSVTSDASLPSVTALTIDSVVAPGRLACDRLLENTGIVPRRPCAEPTATLELPSACSSF